MSIKKVYGFIEEQKSINARIKVISIKRDGEYVNTPSEIKKEFPPEGFVFAPYFFEHFKFEMNSLVEFPFNNYKSNKENGDVFLLDFKAGCKLFGFPVFTLQENFLITDYSINLKILNNHILNLNAPHFYISYNSLLYGPFKNMNDEILPKIGKEVCRWNLSELLIYHSGDKSYLLTAPNKNSDLIDCMTTAQLGAWLKEQVRNLQLGFDCNSLIKSLETLEYEELDIERMKRVLKGFDQITLATSELKYLTESSDKLSELYSQWLLRAREELELELIEPMLNRKKEIEFQVSQQERIKEKMTEDELKKKKSIEVLKKEFESILKQKDRLIEDIKVHSIINAQEQRESNRLFTYDEQVYGINGEPFKDIEDFIRALVTCTEIEQENPSKFWHNSILQFKDYKCIMVNNIEIILSIARLSNNCKVLIQQVEPDWLKFENFYENGLKQIWRSAYANSNMLHFLILEDINMSSIECYGKPLLDINKGTRIKLPGENSQMPSNLWIFGIPLPQERGVDFGLQLIRSTYEKWGFFPKLQSEVLQTTNMFPDKYLTIDDLVDHNTIVAISSNEYFS